MNLEDLKNVQVNLDSATAERIAHEYIRLQYVQSAIWLASLMVAVVCFGLFLWWVSRQA